MRVERGEEVREDGVRGLERRVQVGGREGRRGVVAREAQQVGQRALGVREARGAVAVAAADGAALERAAGVLQEARAVVAPQVGDRVAHLPLDARDAEDVLDAPVERRGGGAEDAPAGRVGPHRDGRRAVAARAHEQREAEEADAAAPRVGVREDLVEVVLLGLGLEGGHPHALEGEAAPLVLVGGLGRLEAQTVEQGAARARGQVEADGRARARRRRARRRSTRASPRRDAKVIGASWSSVGARSCLPAEAGGRSPSCRRAWRP